MCTQKQKKKKNFYQRELKSVSASDRLDKFKSSDLEYPRFGWGEKGEVLINRCNV